MSAPLELTDQIRELYAAADAAGQPRPGRPALVKATGATQYQVTKVRAALALETGPLSVVPNTVNTGVDSAPTAVEPVSTPVDTPAEAVDNTPTPQVTGTAPRPWPLAVISFAAAVAVWGGWVRLGELTGFGPINVLPGIGGGFTINTAIALPLSVEFYAAYALRVLLASAVLAARTRRFARWSVFLSLGVGGMAQVASHVMGAAGMVSAPWWITTAVATVPVLVVGLATSLATMINTDRKGGITP